MHIYIYINIYIYRYIHIYIYIYIYQTHGGATSRDSYWYIYMYIYIYIYIYINQRAFRSDEPGLLSVSTKHILKKYNDTNIENTCQKSTYWRAHVENQYVAHIYVKIMSIFMRVCREYVAHLFIFVWRDRSLGFRNRSRR